MNEQEKADALAAMRQRRIDAVRERTRRETALALLDKHGKVTETEVADAMPETVLDDRALADQMAAKAAAAVEHERSQLASAEATVVSLEAKLAKFKAIADDIKTQIKTAEDEVKATQARIAGAVELAEYAAQQGDASAAPASTVTTAKAGHATATGKAGA